MEAAAGAVRGALTKVAKVAKPKGPPGASRAPTAYLLFGKAHRAANGKVPFAEIGAAWKALGESEKASYEAQARKEKASFVPSRAPAATVDEAVLETPITVKLKDEAALDALAKKAADAVLREFMLELVNRADAGDESVEKVTKVGSFVAKLKETKKPLKNPVVSIEFTPALFMRPKSAD